MVSGGGQGKPAIIVGKKVISRENALKVLRAVRPLVAVGEPAVIVGKKATSSGTVLKVLKTVRLLVGVEGYLQQEATENSKIIQHPLIENFIVLTIRHYVLFK